MPASNIDAQDEALREVVALRAARLLLRHLRHRSFGGFLFRASFEDIEKPILVSSTTASAPKLRVAQAMKIHDTVGTTWSAPA